MAKTKVSLRTQRVLTNKLLKRKQFNIAIAHPKRAALSKKEIQEKIVQAYNVQNPNTVFVFGVKTGFGGGRSSAFGLIYDDVQSAKKFEPNYRLVRQGLEKKTDTSRKQIKERKNRAKRVRGAARTKVLYPGADKK
eukprot:CAMPEP_0117439462 /NCGR_PEP_ID=MMETSP0759-20121206/2577_1 /TAXON_ID=63605 /ORGANISM="Percolomonas cosmopolitus, Strain WS" /LENGTH=135 /DNA_ID=CAMNT_0005231177 /DNA_START=146 /DNA_END=553 /DNA_ORIENTATION=+